MILPALWIFCTPLAPITADRSIGVVLLGAGTGSSWASPLAAVSAEISCLLKLLKLSGVRSGSPKARPFDIMHPRIWCVETNPSGRWAGDFADMQRPFRARGVHLRRHSNA